MFTFLSSISRFLVHHYLMCYSLVTQNYIKTSFISTVDGDDPLGDLLDDLLKDEIQPKSKSSVQQAKSGKSTSPSSPSLIPKSETREPGMIHVYLFFSIFTKSNKHCFCFVRQRRQ